MTGSSESIEDPVIDFISDVSEPSSGGVGATHAFMAICTNDTITETVRGDGSSKVLDHSFWPAEDKDAGGLLRPWAKIAFTYPIVLIGKTVMVGSALLKA